MVGKGGRNAALGWEMTLGLVLVGIDDLFSEVLVGHLRGLCFVRYPSCSFLSLESILGYSRPSLRIRTIGIRH